MVFFADRPALGEPAPPRVSEATTVDVTTDVVVAVPETDGVEVTGVIDGQPVNDAPFASAGEHTVAAGSTIHLRAGAATPVVAGAPSTGQRWLASGGGFGGPHALFAVFSLIVATFLGVMGLPHVLVRFYTNPDGRSARRTAVTVIVLLAVFYLFPLLLGVLARVYVPQLLITGTADAAVLLLPSAAVGGILGELFAALVAAGAIAAFLATSSGLLISVAGALSTDVLPGRVRDFRLAAAIGGALAIVISFAASDLELSRTVGFVFAIAASTLCPLLVLGIWWRGLTPAGAIAGLVVGGLSSGIATSLAIADVVDDEVGNGWPSAIIGYPAAVTVPLAFVTMICVSAMTRRSRVADVSQIFARMHVPERLGLSVERVPEEP